MYYTALRIELLKLTKRRRPSMSIRVMTGSFNEIAAPPSSFRSGSHGENVSLFHLPTFIPNTAKKQFILRAKFS